MKKIKGIQGITIPPYKDMSLKDLPNEKWAPIPRLDEYFLVSNFGRIKRLARETKRAGGTYTMSEKISRVQMCKTLNTVKHDYTYQLFIRPMLDNRFYEFSIKRLVYYCFVEPFDLSDRSVNVIPKNGNGLDIRPDNLVLVSIQKKINRTIRKGRMVNKFEYVDRDKAVRNSKRKTSKKIFQYDGSGKYLASYPSIHEAERQTGIGNNRICAVANGRQVTAGGFYWRHKKVEKINIDAILNQRQGHRREVRGAKVTQYDLEGNPIAWFNSLADAAEAVHCYYTGISAAIRGIVKTAGGFQWRRGHNKKKISAEAASKASDEPPIQ